MILEIVLYICGGLALLTLGAEGLVRGSASLAERIGLSRLIIGLTIVAFGTSSPEMVVSVSAALDGNSAISLGNVIGSNIANIALIAGLSAMVHPIGIDRNIVRYQIPFLIFVSVLICINFIDGILQRYEGLILIAILVVFLFVAIRRSRENSREPVADAKTSQDNSKPGLLNRIPILLILITLGLFFLVAGADFFVKGAILFTERFGVSEGVVGLTIVALGTSLPELATSLVAAYKGESDIAIGNVVGSNIFNILAILGITSMLRPVPQIGITFVDFLVMLGTAIILLPLSKSGFVLDRKEGFVMVLIYVVYVVVIYI
ncbi:MAG: calcium/sodium antiporter [Deltaproteobacteria bacterium]|uniref:Calcium/sodium antiporter n=1 Tax=Candidatus Zymogenus saltonus TaxID=2844893 RepID=A0A9D8KES6_9DELT|nr:calcium/sodium antiporter [Candidatus Zymogenus saltonus]